MVDGAGHFLHLERPVEVESQLLRFIVLAIRRATSSPDLFGVGPLAARAARRVSTP